MPVIGAKREQRTQSFTDFEEVNHFSFLECKMNHYWGERSYSYSRQNLAQLYSEKCSAWENLIFSQMNEDKPLRILDIGTGPGFFAILAALRGHDVVAVDMNENMLDKARQNAEAAGVLINFLQVDHLLPFDDESFDLILSRDVTWTLTEPEKQLCNWASKLRRDGTMLYFDAEWYYYLRDHESRAIWEQKRKQIMHSGGFIYSKADQLENLAIDLPMTYNARPVWDEKFWSMQKNYGFSISKNINSYVYNDREQMQYELFPEFLVAVKRNN